MRDSLILYVNGRRHEVRGRDAFGPLSSWLRYTLGLTGTKVVCAEGDCGSCAVLIGRVVDGAIRYRPVTSCIQYLYQLDATHIVTVEGLTPGRRQWSPATARSAASARPGLSCR
jgi:xanthine dehydrogenase small subunit